MKKKKIITPLFTAVSLALISVSPAVLAAGAGIGSMATNAVSDSLFYSIGGGSVISQPASLNRMQRLGVSAGINSDLMCGNFDIKTTVENQLNGLTSGFKDLMGEVMQGATGAVSSLPGMIIQRANPGLYDMITNGILQAGVSFDKSKLSCEAMSKKLADYTMGDSAWTESAVGDEYRDAINRSGGDATRAEQAKDKATGEEGATWIGGKKAGGKGQPAIQPVRDMAKAGYNMLNGQPVTSNSSVASSACNGSSCQIFKNSDAAATAIVQVLGDRSIRTCKDKSQCESGGTDNAPGASVAGTGFGPLLDESTKVNLEALSKLVSSQGAPSAEELGKLKTGGLPVTRGVIEALRDDTDKNALVQRLAGELAMAHTIETALTMRRILTTGESEPNAAAQKQAIEEGDRRIDSLDRELQALKNEMELRRAISSNSLLVTLERQEVRNSSNQMQQRTPSTDEGMNSLNQKGGE
ncbi:integrating conjugative element protein [Salmonella enterica subsp. enterica]|nr:integrating conjugative element protein [Salmonella enterica]EDT8776262.1 integrating conjugative element protein [Salmonella enterica subsp. enterica serovar Panama]EEA7833041.1 integrating conjugative element protein [Salmonella enterica subsp. enterica serovar Panama]EKC4582618.1 integrating conjugative element protein [Salmonella enterica subsp. enterica]EKC4689441.1 integrating conjugative element protein [Salmonella enterica subsp. enterica]